MPSRGAVRCVWPRESTGDTNVCFNTHRGERGAARRILRRGRSHGSAARPSERQRTEAGRQQCRCRGVRRADLGKSNGGNLTMTNHPLHLHGHEFFVTGTDGGPTPKSSRWPEVTTDVAVGQTRQIDFVADEEGDWAFHCHNGQDERDVPYEAPTMIGVEHRDVVREINKLIPDYMVMAERGMADMSEMEMPNPDNTARMMGGEGPFGSVEMVGMLSTVKVRKDQPRSDCKEPGWYTRPQGTSAFEWTGAMPETPRFASDGG